MSPASIAGTVERLEAEGLRERVLLEASGRIGFADLHPYASTGIDVISMGALTSAAPSLDFSMELRPG